MKEKIPAFSLKVRRPLGQRRIIVKIIMLLFLAWLLVGFYKVAPYEKALLLRFGVYQKTSPPGWHWRFYGIDKVLTVDVAEKTLSYQNEFLAKDEKLVFLDVAASYQIDDLRQYLFANSAPLIVLHNELASAVLEMVAAHDLNTLLNADTANRTVLAEQILNSLQHELNRYYLGIKLVNVFIKDARLPQEISSGVIEPKQVELLAENIINEAKAYREKVLATAVQKSSLIISTAEHEKKLLLLRAENIIQREIIARFWYQGISSAKNSFNRHNAFYQNQFHATLND